MLATLTERGQFIRSRSEHFSKIWKLLALSAMLMAFFVLPGVPAISASEGLNVRAIGSQNPATLAQALLGGGVAISNVSYTGKSIALGTFTGGTGIIGFESGAILSTGSVYNVEGPNTDDGVTRVNNTNGDTDLESLLSNLRTLDAAILEFDFIPDNDIISFQYVFASDEYNDFVGTDFNDVFGFFLNGQNLALVPNTNVAVSINTVNKGKPFGSRRFAQNPEYYINNDLDDGGGALNTEMDGLTTVLEVQASVAAGEEHHIKLAIADVGDRLVDSNVFIKAGSFSGTHAPIAVDDFAITPQDTPINIDVLSNDSDLDGDVLTLTSVTQGIGGWVIINANKTVRYTPNADFVGIDGFSYAVTDGEGVGTASVTVQVLSPDGGENCPQDCDPGETRNVNANATLDDLSTWYDPGDSRADAGVFTISATLTNNSGERLYGLQFEIVILTNGNVVLNADVRPGGAGYHITVPDGATGDGVLDPGESFIQVFEIGLAQASQFSFFVNLFGSTT